MEDTQLVCRACLWEGNILQLQLGTEFDFDDRGNVKEFVTGMCPGCLGTNLRVKQNGYGVKVSVLQKEKVKV